MQDFHGDIPGFEAMSEFANDNLLLDAVVRKQLTKYLSRVTEPLSAETTHALSVNFGDSPEWHEVTLKSTLLDVIARISSRVFLGTQLCRNEEWLSITKAYTINLFVAAVKLRMYPRPLRKLVHWFIPECKKLRGQFDESRRVIHPVIAARRETRRAALAAGEKVPYFNDALDWVDEESSAKGIKYDPVGFQLMLSVAAIHTTTDLLVQVMIDLAQHPEFMELAREEIVRELRDGGWKKASLYNMKLLDSIVKESQRLKPISLAAMRRRAVKDIKLSTGLVLKKGTRTIVDIYRMRDPEVYDNPDEWDGYRFLKLRALPGKDNMAQLVATHRDHLAFGHGIYACPGRSFAANEIKVALCHILMKYDWILAPGTDTQPMVIGASNSSSPTAKILIKKREKIELDVDSV
ncbi:hypothetical protein DL768_008517 [Monosporascus sp. mg162]|nr:hypothetical protein DL768_008517 [Monosporascus sp. mg162]